MNNVHGLDNNQNENNNNDSFLNNRGNGELEILFNKSEFSNKILNESFGSFFISIFLFKDRFITFSVVILLAFLFCLQLAFDWLDDFQIRKLETKSPFLPIKIQGVFSNSLALHGIMVTFHYQMWRLLFSNFIHINFPHLFYSSVSILIFFSLLETLISKKLTLIVIIACGIFSNLFSLCFSDPSDISAGIVPTIFGVLGFVLGYLLFNWQNMEKAPMTKLYLVIFSLLGLFFISQSTTHDVLQIDKHLKFNTWGRLGGFSAGLFLGMSISPGYPMQKKLDFSSIGCMKTTKILGMSFLSIMFFGSILFAFGIKN